MQSLGALTFVCERTGLPKIIASQWLSINESKYSKSYIGQNLYALNLLYEHFSKHPDLEDLDQTFISQDFSAINRGLRSFVSERQNISAIRGVEQSTTVQMACSILISVIEEFNVRTSNFGRNAQELQRSVSSIQVLHKFLRPPKKYRKKKIRSLPYTVIEEIFSLVHPESKRNPFRNEKIRHRNFVIVSILYLMGIRQGELLLLSTNSIKTEFDPIDLYFDVVLKHTEWPTKDYSIKTLARFLGFDWRDTDPSGAASIEWFDQWVKSSDPAIKERILQYNEDDCIATRILLDGLMRL